MQLSRVERAALDEARRLGHSWVGIEHGLLVDPAGYADDPARLALEEAGLVAGTVEGVLAEMAAAGRPASSEPPSASTPNPAWYVVSGRAQGFAASLGTGAVEAAHFVLALLWDRHRWQFAGDGGTARERVVEALARGGMVLPSAPLPPLEHATFTQRSMCPTSSWTQSSTCCSSATRSPLGPRSGSTTTTLTTPE